MLSAIRRSFRDYLSRLPALLVLALTCLAMAACAFEPAPAEDIQAVESVDSVENELTRCLTDPGQTLPKLCTYDRSDGAGIGGQDIALTDGRTDCYRKEAWVTPDKDCYLSKGWHLDGYPSAIKSEVLVRDNYLLADRAVLVWNVTRYGGNPKPCKDRMQNFNVCGF